MFHLKTEFRCVSMFNILLKQKQKKTQARVLCPLRIDKSHSPNLQTYAAKFKNFLNWLLNQDKKILEGQVFRSSASFLEILKNLYSPWHVHFNFPGLHLLVVRHVLIRGSPHYIFFGLLILCKHRNLCFAFFNIFFFK